MKSLRAQTREHLRDQTITQLKTQLSQEVCYKGDTKLTEKLIQVLINQVWFHIYIESVKRMEDSVNP